MASRFDCSDSMVFYKCACGLSTNEKTHYLSHNCDESVDKSEVMYDKHMCNKCITNSYLMLRALSHQIKHNNLKHNKSKSGRLECDQYTFSFSVKADDTVFWYECEKCDWRSKNKTTFKLHWQSKHSIEKNRYPCSECNYQTYQFYNLKRHTLFKHTADSLINWHKCTFCSYQSKAKYLLTRHIKKLHPVIDQIYKCDQCGFETRKRHSLKTHLLMKHTAEHLFEKYKCQICKATFKLKSHFKRHMASYHPNDLMCLNCDYKSKDLIDLRQHLKDQHLQVAKKFACDKCLYDTHNNSNMTRHYSSYHSSK